MLAGAPPFPPLSHHQFLLLIKRLGLLAVDYHASHRSNICSWRLASHSTLDRRPVRVDVSVRAAKSPIADIR